MKACGKMPQKAVMVEYATKKKLRSITIFCFYCFYQRVADIWL